MSVLSSRRRRRRLTIAAVFVVVAIPLGYLAVHYSNSASPRDANGPYVSDAFYRQPTISKRTGPGGHSSFLHPPS